MRPIGVILPQRPRMQQWSRPIIAPGYPWWLEEVVGSVAAAVLLIICIAIGIKNPVLARCLLSHGQDLLSTMMQRIRTEVTVHHHSLPTPQWYSRVNFTDDEIIEMRERNQDNNGHYDAPARSVWI